MMILLYTHLKMIESYNRAIQVQQDTICDRQTQEIEEQEKLINNSKITNMKIKQLIHSFIPHQRKDKSLPKMPNYENLLAKDRSRQSYYMKMGSTTYENERKEKEKITRNKSFIKEIKQKRSHKNLEGHLNLFSEGASSFLFSHKYNDAKDKVTILLNQSDALFEKLLDHLCNLSLSKIQEDRYKSIINEYRESFRQLRI